MQDPQDRTNVRACALSAPTIWFWLKARYKFMHLLTFFQSKLGRIQDIGDKNVRVVKDKFLIQKYTRLDSYKNEFSNIFWGEVHQEWRIYPLSKSALSPLAKKIVFHHRKIGTHWPPWPIIGIFT